MASFPPPATDSIDWANVGFKIREVNGHIESTWSKATNQWTPLKFVRDPYIRIHGMSPALNYGQQAYEGLKAFRTPGDAAIQIFRPDKNAKRMQHSADVASMPRVPEDMFVRACRMAVALNAEFVPPHETGASMYVRPQIYGSSAQLGLTPPEEYTFCVFVVPTGVYHGVHPVKCMILDDFDRAAPRGTGHAKVGGNYAPVLRWTDGARDKGYNITLHLDSVRHNEVDEFSTSGFVGAKVGEDGSVTLVVPDSKAVIDSVTSDSVQNIARSFGWKVEKRAIPYSELPSFSEVMAAGTAAGLVPIRSITRSIPTENPLSLATTVNQHERLAISPDGEEVVTYIPDAQEDAGPLCLRLLGHLKGVQMGKVADEWGWCCKVGEEDTQGIEKA